PLVSPKASAPGISLTSSGQPRYSRLRARTSLALGGRRPLRRGRLCGEPSRGARRSLRRYRRAAVFSRGVLSVGVRRKRAGGRRGVRRCRAGDQVSAAPLAVPCAICAILALRRGEPLLRTVLLPALPALVAFLVVTPSVRRAVPAAAFALCVTAMLSARWLNRESRPVESLGGWARVHALERGA